jgi:alpha-L-fucosidase
MRQLQPHMLINNRASLPGDFDTPEQRSGFYQERPWEACLSLTESWSWTGTPPKSRDQLVRILASAACANGNALVSWGPHWDGAFDEKEVSRLREVGDWLKKNGTSIYSTRGGPWLPTTWGGSTRNGNTVYLHVLKPELTTLELPPISSRVESAALLNGGTATTFEQTSRGFHLVLPVAGRDPADTVVVLRLDRAATETVRSCRSACPFDDPVAYGKIVSVQTNVPVSREMAILDLKTMRKVTGVVVEQAGGSSPLSLSLSEDNRNWTQVAAINEPPLLWEVTVENLAAGALLPGRNARYVRIMMPGAISPFTLQRVQVHGF